MTQTGPNIVAGRFPPLRRLLRIVLGQALLSGASIWLDDASFDLTGMSVVWLTNGFLIGVLLRTPKRQWPALLALCYSFDCTLNRLQSNTLAASLLLSVCNSIEVLLAALLMYRAVAARPELTEWRQMRSLLLNAVLLAPLTCSFLATVFLHFSMGAAFLNAFRSWFAADALGAAVMTPLYLSRYGPERSSSGFRIEAVAMYAVVGVATLAVFRGTGLPMLWCVLMALLLLGVRQGFTASALGLLAVLYVGGFLTVHGYGPLGKGAHASAATRVLVLQVFVGATMLALYITEAALTAKRRVMQRLESSEARFRSLAEASLDPIVLAGLDGRRHYVSPALTEMTGWTEQELLSQTMTDSTHPEDLPAIRQRLGALANGVNHGALEYRYRRKDGSWIWVEGRGRMLEERGKAATDFVIVIRDISARKAAEEEMRNAYRDAETLALTDGLTGLPNRRKLDRTLELQWASCRRDCTPLSVLLIDIDWFKSYNDGNGHQQGDECLRQVAGAMQSALQRPMDLLARYGGEEFMAVLPNTPVDGAETLAEVLRAAVEQRAIPHPGSPYGVVTVSIGCASKVPEEGRSLARLVDRADAALYEAKASGRNRARAATLPRKPAMDYVIQQRIDIVLEPAAAGLQQDPEVPERSQRR